MECKNIRLNITTFFMMHIKINLTFLTLTEKYMRFISVMKIKNVK